MRSNYRRIGEFIKRINNRNLQLETTNLLGINIDKYFMPSVANVQGTDLSKYKIVCKNQFSCNRMHVGRDKRLPIALSTSEESFIVSPAYDVFEIVKTKQLLPEYLMMWLSRKEFDRNTWFYTDSDVRGKLGWEDFCNIELPVPSIEKQRVIVKEYKTVVNRIKLNEQLNQKLEETAQALYKHWFVDFEFPNENGKPYKSSGGKMIWNEELEQEIPEGWENGYLEELFLLQRGFDLPSNKRKKGLYPVFASTGVSSFHHEYKIKAPGVVTGRSGSLGKVFYIDENFWALNTTLWIKEFKKSNPSYAFFFLKNMNILEYKSGSAVPTLNRNHIHKHRTYIPNIEVQNKFQVYFLILRKKIRLLKKQKGKLIELSQILLSKLSQTQEQAASILKTH